MQTARRLEKSFLCFARSWNMVAVLLLVLSGMWTPNQLVAQVASGLYPHGSFDNRGPDVINVGNLNIHLSVPVVQKPGRGLPFAYSLAYDSSIWFPSIQTGSTAWTPLPLFGWKGDTDAVTGYVSYQTSTVTTPDSQGPAPPRGGRPPTCTTATYSWIYVDSFGTSHGFNGTTSKLTQGIGDDCDQPQPSFTETASDGSGYTLSVYLYTHASVTSAAGSKITAPVMTTGAGTITDANGNQISVDGSGNFTDTSGTVVLTASGSAPNAKVLTYRDTNGNPQSVTVTYKTYSVRTAFGCSGVSEYGPTSNSLVDRITFPDQSFYAFSYEPTPNVAGSVSGRIASMQLPTGGIISYAYTGGNNGIVCADGSASGLTRSASAVSGSSAVTISYSRSSAGAGLSHTNITDGGGNIAQADFTVPQNAPSGTTALLYPTSFSQFQGAASGTPLISSTTCYAFAPQHCGPASATSFSLPIVQISQSNVFDGVEQNASSRSFDSVTGLPLGSSICDFQSGNCQNAFLMSQVSPLETYQNGVSVPIRTQMSDSSGIFSETDYGYDESSAVTTSGVPNHVAISGSRANLTSIKRLVDGANALTQTMTVADTGSTVSVNDSINGTTSLGYESTYLYNTSVVPPLPASGISLASSKTFDSNSGLPTSATDANGSTTAISSYDAMLRPKVIDMPEGGKITYTYTPTQTSQFRVMSGGTEDTESFVDVYGRTIRSAISTSNAWYLQDTCYDANGRVSFTSYPYQATSLTQAQLCSGAGDSYQYDALGRILNLTHAGGTAITWMYKGRTTKSADENGVAKLTQVDGAGRIVAVCELTGSTLPYSGSPVSCGMDIAGNGYLTTYAYDLFHHQMNVAQGGQVRIFQTDWLGRTTSIQEPESGITTFAYTQNPTGQVVTRKRPRANQTNASVLTTTTTQYDTAGRILSVTYDDGTPVRTFTYDEATAFGAGNISLGKSKGHLTGHSSAGGSTKGAFGYDGLGRVIATVQCEPSNCASSGYKTTSYTFDPVGNLLSSTDGAGLTASYLYNIASQPTIVTSAIGGNAPATLLSSAQYGPNGPLSVALGNGLTAVNGYDGRGLLNGRWLCTGSSMPGCSGGNLSYGMQVSWSGQRAASSLDTVLGQSATYGYDDLNRLSARTITAGTTQNFTYSYDRWGNRTAQNALQIGPTFTPNYTGSNQIAPAYGSTYDAAGNVVSDSIHSYTYDAENNLVLVDGGSTAVSTYNALNQRVRITGGTTSEFVFHADGSRASTWDGNGHLVSSQSYLGSIPLALYTGGTYHFQHQDWLGTERLRTSASGAIEGSYASLPFGDGFTASGTDQDPSHFTGLDQDSSSATVHALYRQYSTISGRWMSPDAYGGSYDFGNPQSLNRYSYALNNPLSYRDPLGLNICFYGGKGDTIENDDDASDFEDISAADCAANGGTSYGVGSSVDVNGNDGGGGVYITGYYIYGSGLGSVSKHYSRNISCGHSANQAMSAVQDMFPSYANYKTWDHTESVTFNPPSPINVGSTIPINVGLLGFNQSLSVDVQSLTPQNMTFITNPGHLLYPASITFSASQASSSSINFNIAVSGSIPSAINGIEFAFGGGNFEDASWNHFLDQVGVFCDVGGR